MSAQIIDGKEISSSIIQEITQKVLERKNSGKIIPCLSVILVGENPASVSYVKAKQKMLSEIGMIDKSFHLEENTSEEELLSLIEKLNSDKSVHGILVQLPLPKHISEEKIINAIKSEKDVDGFHPVNAGNLLLGNKCIKPCTPSGIIELLKRTGVKTEGKRAVVIGRSNIVGKPCSILLLQKECNATVTVCHSATKNLEKFTKEADIIVVATGKPCTLTGDMVSPGACVIDVGVNRIPDASKKTGYRLVGDVDFESVKEVASFITPVPGGVGPMTIAMLMKNTYDAAVNQSL